ncbi:MAG: glycosyltransferase family 2 protein [Candidatus Hydrogenedentes bacterium]|nr:glycosyltransferase family 2 protein [Candidatus Hydrogenedentota bacterium]
MSATLSVVIPTWNHRDLLAECLKSLAAQSRQAGEIIVVDDGSTDDTAVYVAREWPDVRLVRLEKNSGFCAAVNSGIRAATGDWVFLLNNDMTLAADCLERLMEAACEGVAAMLAPLALFRDDPDTIYSAGDRQRADGRPEAIGFRQRLEGFRFPKTIFGVSGGAGLYRREVFDRVGLLDERFIAYFEDSDLNFRARLAGFDANLVREAIAYHVGSASLGGKTWWRSRQCFRNHALLIIKNLPLPLFVRNFPSIVRERLHQARRLVSSARTEFGLVRALAMLGAAGFDTLTAIPHCLRERRKIQRTRRISIDELKRLMGEGESAD